MGLNVDSVKLVIDKLHIESEPFSASVPHPGKLDVFVSHESLATFLNHKAPGGFRNFQVHSDGGQLIVSATMKMILEVKATATCTLRIAKGEQLFVDLQHVSIMGAGATQLVQSQLEKMNPVLDMCEFPIPAKIESVHIEAQGIRLHGHVSPPS